jgi:O-antigen ligase
MLAAKFKSSRHLLERSLEGSRERLRETDERSLLFVFSALMFRIGLALVTFEQDRPYDMMLSDYCFFVSLLFILPTWKSRLKKAAGSGVLLAGGLILSGAMLSMLSDSNFSDAIGPLVKLFVLFGLFAPLALVHSKNIRKNMLYLIVGISVNCAITLVQAWVFPGILDALSINPQTPDLSESWRFQGLTEFPVTLGLSAAIGVLLALGLLMSERSRHMRWGLAFLAIISSVGALLSGSRTFLAALIPGLIVLAMLQKQRRRAFVHASIALVVLWGALSYLVPSAVSEFSGRLDEVGLVDYSRLAVAAQAVLEISQKPFLGWGINHFGEAGSLPLPDVNVIQPAHNTFLQYWYGAGLLGAIGFLALFAMPAMRMLKVLKRKTSKRSANMVCLMLASYTCFFIIVNLGPYLYNRYLYIPMFLFAGFVARFRGRVAVRAVSRRGSFSTNPRPSIQLST